MPRSTVVLAALAIVVGQLTSPPLGHAANYDRDAAASWARGRVYDDPSQLNFDDDCTWFVSRALWAGGLPQSSDWTPMTLDPGKAASKKIGFYPGPTKTAAAADYLKNYLVSSGLATIRELDWSQNDPPDARLGDIIGYDWNGGADGAIDHVMMITNFSAGYPLVSGHTAPEIDAGWTWSNKFNGWIDQVPQYRNGNNGPRAYLMHINA